LAAVAEDYKTLGRKLRATDWPDELVKWIGDNFPEAQDITPRDYYRWRRGALGKR
jgi:hypothetical protein